MMKIYIFLFISFFIAFADEKQNQTNDKIQNTLTKNIWIKSYQNYKNYNIIINNIAKIQQKMLLDKNNIVLTNKLDLYKSKLELYGNNNFEHILKSYKFETPTITLRDFLLNKSKNDLEKYISKYITLKNDFYLATFSMQHSYNQMKEDTTNKQKLHAIQEDIEYFSEYSENIEKTYQNLLESKDELNKKYQEYNDEVFLKHVMTFGIIIVLYIFYRIISFILFYITHNKKNHNEQQNYKKLLSLLFTLSMLIFIIIRYIDDFIYIITFLSVVAAALTIALREILLNIVGAIYIFFSSVVKVGDRIMVQFETKHTIGDVVDISLVKIKLNETEDYSNLKEIKNVGRTTYIPNSFIFTKVFYNYSLKKHGMINDLIEFEFTMGSDFDVVDQVTNEIFSKNDIAYKMTFALNNLKTGFVGLISYEINYKEATKKRGEISILLLDAYQKNEFVKLKIAKNVVNKVADDE